MKQKYINIKDENIRVKANAVPIDQNIHNPSETVENHTYIDLSKKKIE